MLTFIFLLDPAKTAKKPAKKPPIPKRKIEEVRAEIPDSETVEFDPLRPGTRDPNIHIPPNTDIFSFYALFSLFFEEDIYQRISESTNSYARVKRKGEKNEEDERS